MEPDSQNVALCKRHLAADSERARVIQVKGEVVGVAAARLRRGQDLNFAVPLEQILTLKQINPATLALWSNPRRRPDSHDLFLEGLASMKLGDCEQGLRYFVLATKRNPTKSVDRENALQKGP